MKRILQSNGFKRLSLYVFLVIIIHITIEQYHFSDLITVILSLFFIIPELISDYHPQTLATLFIYRQAVVIGVLSICTALYGVFFYLFPYKLETITNLQIKPIIEFLLLGALMGLITRMLMIHFFYELIRGKDVFNSKILIMVVYVVLLIMLPVTHKSLLSFFALGFGIGFVIHFLSRISEKRNARHNRLKQNLLSMIESIKKEEYKLTSIEEKAINLYANHKWRKLNHLLQESHKSDVLFFIELSMLRKLHQYEKALRLIDEKENEQPDWISQHKHFIHLHIALNIGEQQQSKLKEDEIINNLQKAITLNHTCLLSNASLALRLANNIDLDKISLTPTQDEETVARKKASLSLIWNAMKIYESRNINPKVISLVTGMTVPFTYSFLLDTYGYVLLKNGYLRFSKALLIQCLYQDPSFSPTYLHLAEWYIADSKNKYRKPKHWQKAAKLNLHIAIQNERLDNKGNNESFISTKAKKLLASF